jgi:preprotein translocase subunit Sec63
MPAATNTNATVDNSVLTLVLFLYMDICISIRQAPHITFEDMTSVSLLLLENIVGIIGIASVKALQINLGINL